MTAPERPRAGARVELRGIGMAYGSRRVLRSVDLDVRPGEFITLLGPSGSGKTTTLDIVAGLATPTQGHVRVDGRDLTRVPAHRRGLGIVPQDRVLFPHRTVLENVLFPLRQRALGRATARDMAARALEMVRMSEFGERRPAELSGGQQQRVALARALVHEPRVLLLDEPFGAVDRRLRESLQREVTRIHREVGSTFLLVTHDQQEALTLSDRIAVLNHGEIEQVGTPEELYERPRTLFVARFLGDSSSLVGTWRPEPSGGGVLDLGDAAIRTVGTLPSSGEGVLVLRPESLSVVRPGARDEPTRAAVPARVVEEVYLGSQRRLELVRPDGTPLRVTECAGRWSDLRRGDDAVVTWPRDAGVLLASGAC